LKSPQAKRQKAAARARNNSQQNRRCRARSGLNKTETSYYQQIWWDALCDLRHQLTAHCRGSEPDKLRFQTGQLFNNLLHRLKGRPGKELLKAMARCYSVGMNPRLLPYAEARRLHREEIEALSSSYPPGASKTKRDSDREELFQGMALIANISSLASWIEAQESFAMWLEFKSNLAFWHSNNSEREDEAFQAAMLSQLPTFPIATVFRGKQLLGANRKGDPWKPRQWANILERAARLAEKESNCCTELDQWIWWCYPIFYRYGWSAREVKGLAAGRGFSVPVEKHSLGEANFRRYWITRGLRFAGRRRKRSDPPLAEFVRNVSLPNLDNVLGGVPWPLPNSLQKKAH
jgi:hypothetical protein